MNKVLKLTFLGMTIVGLALSVQITAKDKNPVTVHQISPEQRQAVEQTLQRLASQGEATEKAVEQALALQRFASQRQAMQR